MTAPQVIEEIEASGGTLMLSGDRIRYDVPKEAAHLVDILRGRRDEVLHVLRARNDAAKRQLSRWMAARCACPTSQQRVWGSEQSLYLDYLDWCKKYCQASCSRELFVVILNESFHREGVGWQGLCLAADFAARIMTKRLQ